MTSNLSRDTEEFEIHDSKPVVQEQIQTISILDPKLDPT